MKKGLLLIFLCSIPNLIWVLYYCYKDNSIEPFIIFVKSIFIVFAFLSWVIFCWWLVLIRKDNKKSIKNKCKSCNKPFDISSPYNPICCSKECYNKLYPWLYGK